MSASTRATGSAVPWRYGPLDTQRLIRDKAPPLAEPSVAVLGGLESIALANPNVFDEEKIWLLAVEERIYNERGFVSEQGR